MRWLAIFVLGIGLGLMAALGDAGNGVVRPTVTGQALTIATHLGTTYAAAAVAAGWLLAERRFALLSGPVALVAAIVGYVGYVDWFVDHRRFDVANVAAVFGIYLVAAVTIGPLLAMIGQVARGVGPMATLARMAVPVALVAEVAVRFPLHVASYDHAPTRAWTLTAIMGVGVLGFFAAALGARSAKKH